MLWIFVVTVILWALPVQATERYVDAATGVDTGSCPFGAPCATPTFVMPSMANGDNMNLKCNLPLTGGTYRIPSQLNTNGSGTPSAKRGIRSYGNCIQVKGTHTGSNDASVLTDSTKDFVLLGVVAGMYLRNISDASSCIVTSVTTTTLTCGTTPLLGGQENDWDSTPFADEYEVSNWPVVTRATLFNSGWTNEGSNVWSHAVAINPQRNVWINRSLMWGDQQYTGTCTVANLAGQGDLRYCYANGRLYLRTSSNPATRWASPNIGVEVVEQTGTLSEVFKIDDNWWTCTRVQFAMTVLGSYVLRPTGDNNVLDGCNAFNASPRFTGGGSGNGGGEVLGFQGNNNTIRNGIYHSCGRSCVTTDGNGTTSTGMVFEDNIIYGAPDYSAFSHGIGGNVATFTLVNHIIRRNKIHQVCSGYFTGNQGTVHDNTLLENNIYEHPILPGDSRNYPPSSGCGTAIGMQFANFASPNAFVLRGNIVRGSRDAGGTNNWQYGISLGKGPWILERNTVTESTDIGIRIPLGGAGGTLTWNDNVVALNGDSGTTSVNNAQVSCSSNCTLLTVSGNRNIVRQVGGGAPFALSSIDTSMTLAEWRTHHSGAQDDNSKDEDPLWVARTTGDFNRNVSPCDDGNTTQPYTGSARCIGTYEPPTIGICTTIDTDTWQCPITTLYSPIAVTCSLITPKRTAPSSVSGTANNCSIVNNINVRFDVVGFSPTAGDTLVADFAYGAVRDAHQVGKDTSLVAKNAATTNVTVTNNIVGTAPSISSCVIGDTDRNKLRATINTQGSPPIVLGGCPAGFTADDDGVANNPTACALIGSDTIEFTVPANFTTVSGTGNRLSYSQSTGSTTNTAGVELAAVTNLVCQTDIGTAPPTIVSAVVSNTARTKVVYTVDLGSGTSLSPTTGMTGITVSGKTVNSCVRVP